MPVVYFADAVSTNLWAEQHELYARFLFVPLAVEKNESKMVQLEKFSALLIL